MLHVFYLDRYHLGDPLFLNQLAARLGRFGKPSILVHGAAEDGERLLEAEGGVTTWRDGVLVVGSDGERRIVERAARDLNRRIAHALNDAAVASIRADGGSRGLFFSDEAGGVEPGDVDWLLDLAQEGVVPVVAALTPGVDGPMLQASGGSVSAALASASNDAVVVIFIKEMPAEAGATVSLSDLAPEMIPEPDVLTRLHESGAHVLLTTPRGIGEAGLQAVRLGP